MASARPWKPMLIAADRKLSIPENAAICAVKVSAADAPTGLDVNRYFGGFSSFHGSFTFGIESNSTLASLPSFISILRM